MEYRRLGRAGLKVSALSFGAWVTFGNQMDTKDAEACMTYAYDNGVNFFDNAEVYAYGVAEEIMGKILQKTGWRRDTYCVSSKAYFGCVQNPAPTQLGLHRKHLMDACHQALKRLQVDYLDMYFCHRPDPETPIEETVRTMNDLVQHGKIIYWGTSEWSAPEIVEAYRVARQYGLTPPTMEQPQYNMLVRERFEEEYARLYREMGLGTTIWSPLASGILTGKYNDGIPAESRMNVDGYEWLRDLIESEKGKRRIEKARQLSVIAADLEVSLAQLSIAWCLKNSNVSTVILGASRQSQLEETMRSIDIVPKLTDNVMARIESILAQ